MADSIVPPSEPVAPPAPPAVAAAWEPDTKVFYASATFWSAILVVAGFLFKSLAIEPALRDGLAGALAILGGAGIAWGRQRATKKLTWRRRRH